MSHNRSALEGVGIISGTTIGVIKGDTGMLKVWALDFRGLGARGIRLREASRDFLAVLTTGTRWCHREIAAEPRACEGLGFRLKGYSHSPRLSR